MKSLPGLIIMVLLLVVLLGACFFALSSMNPVSSPIIRAAKCLSGGSIMEDCRGGYLVDFQDIMPPTLRVQNLQRMDTDGDGQQEWVVFYYYDITGATGPIAGAVYDNDRGWPPVLFPYQLRVPDRDYLGEYKLTAQQKDIVPKQPSEAKAPELLVWDGGVGGPGLSIFRYNPGAKTEEWKPPEDRATYFPIGVFRGDSVGFDETTKQVTVWDRGGFATGAMAADHERSQLTNKRVYSLFGDTYMNASDLTALSAPTESYIEFSGGQMPDNVLATQYPEKIVLGFYKALSSEGSAGVKAEDFLTGLARGQYDQGRLDYFGIPWGKGDSGTVRVTYLSYPTLKEEQTAEVDSMGLHSLGGQVTVQVVAQPKDQNPLQPVQRTWTLVLEKGQWKMEERVP
jgi:hypothetical protein